METLFGRQIVLSRHKKMVKDNSLGAKVDLFLILNTDANQKMPKKKSCQRHFNSLGHSTLFHQILLQSPFHFGLPGLALDSAWQSK